MKNRSVAIWDNNQLFREGLRSLLDNLHFTVVSSSESLSDVLRGAGCERQPSLIICGLGSTDELPTDLADWRPVGSSCPRLVILANMPTPSLLRWAAEAGVYAVLSKNISAEVLQRALEFVLLGQRLFPAPHIDSVEGGRLEILPPVTTLRSMQSMDRRRLADETVQLSEREAQILGCLVEGAPNKRIARDLGITEATVKVHIKGLLRKLRVNNRTQAAVWGLNNPNAADPRMSALQVVEPAVPFAIVS